jgi:hypothetical protein
MGVHPHGLSDILSASPSLVDLSLGIKYGPAEGLISDIANYALAPNVQTFQTPLRYADLFMGMLEHGFVPSVQSVTILGSMQKACGAVLISANQLRAQGIDVTFQVDDHMEI